MIKHGKHAGFEVRWSLDRLTFDTENGSDMFSRNADSYTDYTEPYPTKWQHSRYIINR
jgi:hypothetical protein